MKGFAVLGVLFLLVFFGLAHDDNSDRRKPAFVGMCFETTSAQKDILKITSLQKYKDKSLFGLMTEENIAIEVTVVKFGNRDEIINGMKPFRTMYLPNGYIQVNCPV